MHYNIVIRALALNPREQSAIPVKNEKLPRVAYLSSEATHLLRARSRSNGAADRLLLNGVGSNESRIGISKDSRSGLFTALVLESLALDGIDIYVRRGTGDLETTDIVEGLDNGSIGGYAERNSILLGRAVVWLDAGCRLDLDCGRNDAAN